MSQTVAQPGHDALDQVDGAVLAAGATDGDRQIAAVGLAELGDPAIQKLPEIVEVVPEIVEDAKLE